MLIFDWLRILDPWCNEPISISVGCDFSDSCNLLRYHIESEPISLFLEIRKSLVGAISELFAFIFREVARARYEIVNAVAAKETLNVRDQRMYPF